MSERATHEEATGAGVRNESNCNSPIVHCDNITLSEDGASVVIVDQTQLPAQEVRLSLSTAEECFDAIKRLCVRGAPAIGVFAGYAFYVVARSFPHGSFANFRERAAQTCDYLASSRPTAVNLQWALNRMMSVVDSFGAADSKSQAESAEFSQQALLDALRREAYRIQAEDVDVCTRISQLGLTLLRDGQGIITHCNAGPLATSKYGTSLGPILLGHEQGMSFHVYADETRPLLQGARLTAYELDQAGVDVTLICDNMASIVMRQGRVQACLVGCDRVAANGDTANKIGTSGLAIIAARYNVPFYVMCPTSTIDMACATGSDIPIELRDGDEIKTMWYEHPMAPDDVRCFNPSFDVTDNDLIAAIVTERGICRAPYTESLAALFGE